MGAWGDFRTERRLRAEGITADGVSYVPRTVRDLEPDDADGDDSAWGDLEVEASTEPTRRDRHQGTSDQAGPRASPPGADV